METQFVDKVCIVTGSSSGVGEAIALMFAKRGASVTLCGRHDERLQSVLDRCIEESGGHEDRFLVVKGEILNSDVRKDIVNKTVEKWGQVDVLVNAAGISSNKGSIRECTEECFDQLFNVNVKSVFFQIQETLPHLEKSKGNIVTISSMGGSLVGTPVVTYPMSKAAIDHMTRCLALDLASTGIRVNAVNPSWFPSRIRRYLGSDEEIDQYNEKSKTKESKMQPLENRCVKPEEIAEAVLFLASNSASFITGQCLLVDGGRTLTGPYGKYSLASAS